MTCIVDKFLGADKPITLEAPIIKGFDSLNEFVKNFVKYKLHKHILALNLTNYPMGILSPDPVAIGCYLKKDLNIDIIPHIAASIEIEYTLARTLMTAYLCGLKSLLVLGGDIKDSRGLELRKVYEIIEMFKNGRIKLCEREWITEKINFCLGGALIPYRSNELDRILWKISRGIRFFQTQIVINKEEITSLLNELDRKLDKIDIDKPIPILIGIAPFKSDKVLRWIKGNIKKPIKSDLKPDNYETLMLKLSMDLMEEGMKFKNLHLGLHIIPIEWTEKTFEKVHNYIIKLNTLL